MKMEDVDFKGLDPYIIQSAINAYYWNNKVRYEQRKRVEESRQAQGKRARVRNAIKRASVRVLTQDSSWQARGWTLSDRPYYSNGYYSIHSNQSVEITDKDLRKLLASPELDVKNKLRFTVRGVELQTFVKLKEKL